MNNKENKNIHIYKKTNIYTKHKKMYPANKYIKVLRDIQNDTYKHKTIFIVRNRIYYKIRYNINIIQVDTIKL